VRIVAVKFINFNIKKIYKNHLPYFFHSRSFMFCYHNTKFNNIIRFDENISNEVLCYQIKFKIQGV